MKILTLLALAIGMGGLASAQLQPNFYARRDLDSYIICQQPQGVVQVADFNGDGNPDLLCSTMQLGNGDGTFRPGPAFTASYTAKGQANAIDVNGDGKADAVYPDFQHGHLGISVMLGNGDATFQSPLFYPSSSTNDVVPAGGDPIVFGDYNGDGIVDAVLLCSTQVIFFAGRPDGAFQASGTVPVSLPAGYSPVTLAALDVNGDGDLDLVVDVSSAIEVLFGNGNGTFQRPIVTRIASGSGFAVMAVGDLNQDGIPDVVLQAYNTNTVNLYFGKADGTFRAAQSLNIPGDGPAQAIAIADLNGDGIPDLVDDLVEVALGKGHGDFAPAVYYPVNGASLFAGGGAIAVGNFQNTGRLDLVIQDSYGLSILLNAGRGTFIDGVPTTVPGGRIACSAAGDFNRDGIPDLALSTNSSILIYLGTGKAAAPYKAGATYPLASDGCPVAGDLNGDGKIDILIPAGSPTAAYAYLGNGDGTFQAGPASSLPEVCFFSLADFNGDGILDYVTSTNLMAYGNGDGSFSTPVTIVPGAYFVDIATADMNGDGRPDIIATQHGNLLDVLLNNGDGTFKETTTTACDEANHIGVGDADGDGKPDVAISCADEVGLYLNNGDGGLAAPAFFEEPSQEYIGVLAIADLNGDGIADLESAEPGNVVVWLGEGAGKFASPIFLGTGNATEDFHMLNSHKQTTKGTPDLVVTDESGVIYDLINETQ